MFIVKGVRETQKRSYSGPTSGQGELYIRLFPTAIIFKDLTEAHQIHVLRSMTYIMMSILKMGNIP